MFPGRVCLLLVHAPFPDDGGDKNPLGDAPRGHIRCADVTPCRVQCGSLLTELENNVQTTAASKKLLRTFVDTKLLVCFGVGAYLRTPTSFMMYAFCLLCPIPLHSNLLTCNARQWFPPAIADGEKLKRDV